MFHIDWRSKRTKAVIRFFGYIVMTVMTVVTATVLIYFAKGYRFNRQTGKIIRDGLVLIDSKPVSARVSIDGRTRNTTPARYVLPAGSYNFQLSAPGYRTWSKTIDLAGSYVEWINYPLLFPSSIETVQAMALPESPQLLSSPNNQFLFVRGAKDNKKIATIYQTTDLAKAIDIPLSKEANNKSQADKLGTYKAVEWAADSRHILIEHRVSNRTEYLVVDVKKPDNILNVSKLVNSKLSSLRFASSDGKLIYAMVGSRLELLDTTHKPATTKLLLDRVYSYKSVDEDKVLFAAPSTTPGLVDVGVLKDGKKYIVDQVKSVKRQYLLGYTSYAGDDYLVVGYSDKTLVNIYKNPLSDYGSQPPKSFVDFQVKQPQSLTISDNGQFAAVRSGKNFAVYDLDNERLYSYGSQLALSSKTKVAWMDGSRLIATVGGKVYVWDFDNTNLQQLVGASNNYPVIFDPKFQRMFTVDHGARSSDVVLKLSSMLSDEHPADMLDSN